MTPIKTALDYGLRDYLDEGPSGRRQTIDVAAALFRERGFAAVSMNEIASAVGLSKPGLYHHWPSKDTILHVIAQLSGEILLNHLDVVERSGFAPSQTLHHYVISRLEAVTQHQDLFTVTWQERAILGTRTFEGLARMAEDYRRRVRALIDTAKSEGVIKPDVDSHLLMLALDGMTGWAYFWYRPSGDFDIREISDAFWAMLGMGVLMPDGTNQP